MGDSIKTNNLLLVTLRGNRPDSNVVTLITKGISDQGFWCNKKSTSYIRDRTDKLNEEEEEDDYDGEDDDEEEESCHSIYVEDKSIEDRLYTVARHLTRLTQVNHRDQEANNSHSRYISTYNLESRIETVLAIYSKLLSLGPLELHLVPKNGSDAKFDLLKLRLQVLHFIENLDGYCNSISMLRLILKSPTMIGAIFAHKSIIDALELGR